MRASAGELTIAGVRVTPEGAARALLYILPLAVGFGQSVTLAVKGLRASLTDLIVAALVALSVYSLWRMGAFDGLDVRRDARQWRRVRPDAYALLLALLAYLLVILLSFIVAYSHVLVIKEALKWGEVIVVVCAAWGFIRSERQAIWLAWAAIGAGLLEALLGCAQDVLATGFVGSSGSASLRVAGTFDQPNPYGGYLNLTLPLALSLALFGRDPRMRWVAGGASAIMLFALYLSDSRGAFLGFAAALVVIIAVGFRLERKAGYALAIGTPLLLVAWFTHIIPTSLENKLLAQFRVNDVSLTGQVDNANYSTIERLAHWVAGIRMFQAHPILGVGAGNYGVAYTFYKVPGWDASLGHAHNYYINAAAETGALGLIAFLGVVAAAIYVCWRATRMTDLRRGGQLPLAGPDARALAIGFAAVVVALCVHNFTDNLFVHAMELQFALTLGVLLRLAAAKLPRRGGASASQSVQLSNAG